MLAQGAIVKCRADDIPGFRNSGWKLVPHKAFKNTCPEVLSTLDPLPPLQREDYKQHLREQNIAYEF